MNHARATAFLLAQVPAMAGPAENEAAIRQGVEEMLGQGRARCG